MTIDNSTIIEMFSFSDKEKKIWKFRAVDHSI